MFISVGNINRTEYANGKGGSVDQNDQQCLQQTQFYPRLVNVVNRVKKVYVAKGPSVLPTALQIAVPKQQKPLIEKE